MGEIKRGYFYLHTNRELIYKPDIDGRLKEDLDSSDLVTAYWPVASDDRESLWTCLVEAAARGANPEKIEFMVKTHGMDSADAVMYAERIGFKLAGSDVRKLWAAFSSNFVDQRHSGIGLGETAFDAIVELCRSLTALYAKQATSNLLEAKTKGFRALVEHNERINELLT